MARYVAFLRAVNVSGHNVVTMEDLRRTFARAGLGDVATLGASGNVLFETDAPRAGVRATLEGALRRRLGRDVPVVLRSAAELARTVRAAPFGDAPAAAPRPITVVDGDRLRKVPARREYVTFLADGRVRELPARSRPGDPEFLGHAGRDVFSVVPFAGGRFRDPTLVLERALDTRATTRTWSVVQELARRIAVR